MTFEQFLNFIEAMNIAEDVIPCSNCQEWDCVGCKVKEAIKKEKDND